MRIRNNGRRWVAVMGVTATVVAGLIATGVSQPAAAAVNDQSLSGTRSPMWQTNNNVEALAVSNGVVYAGGTFTRVRPPGAAAGSQETARTYLAAFSASTGALITSFNVTLNGAVNDLAISPDGSTLYVGGAFTTVNGATRQRLAAISIPGSTLNTTFVANAGSTVTAVTATATTVYVSGDFGQIKGVAKGKMASLNATNGNVNTGFTANLDARANSVVLAPDGSRLLIGGNFATVNGAAPSGIASVNPVTGAVLPWAANDTFPINGPCAGRVTDIVVQGAQAYVTAEGDPPGCYEGTYAAQISTGQLVWNSTCLGASQGLALLNNILYKASHQHDCAFNLGDARGGFVGGRSRDTFIWMRLAGQNISDGGFVHWTPNTNATTGNDPVGPHVLATDGTQMFVGGDFTQVDNQAQQGLARYGTGNNSAPLNIQNGVVNVQPTASGTLSVTWPAVYDRDSGTLTYNVYRDGGNAPVYSTTAESYPWSRPFLRFDDRNLAAGSSHSYRISATDGTFTNTRSTAVTGVVRTSAPAAYPAQVNGSAPGLYWRLADTGGTAADSSPSGSATGVFQGGVTTGAAGALTSNAAVALNGTSSYVTSAAPLPLSSSFSQTAWFRTTSVRGGVITAMSDQQTGSGGNTDRAITMDNNGNIVTALKQAGGGGGPFGPRLTAVRVQGPTYNDGRWHQVASTYDGTTLSLYVDGTLSASTTGSAAGMTSGYQRVGYADVSSIQTVFGINFYHQTWPASPFFQGSIDEVASYPTALPASAIAALFAAGVGGGA